MCIWVTVSLFTCYKTCKLFLFHDCHQRSFSLQYMETITKSYNWTHCKGQWVVGCQAEMEHLQHGFSSGNMKKGTERLYNSESQEACYMIPSFRKCCINKPWTVTASTNVFMQQREIFMASHPLSNNYKQTAAAKRNRISLSQGEIPKWTSIQSFQPWHHT